MASVQSNYQMAGFRVIHPLQDAPETKCESKGPGPIAMTPSVRFSLMALRGYLILMSLLLLWRVLGMAGLTHGF